MKLMFRAICAFMYAYYQKIIQIQTTNKLIESKRNIKNCVKRLITQSIIWSR